MTKEEALGVVPGDELWHVRIWDRSVEHLVFRSVSLLHPVWLTNYWANVIDDSGREKLLPIDVLFRDREEADRYAMVEAMKRP
jgi:hypothetical protein